MGLLDKAYGVYKETIPMDFRFYLQGLLGDKDKPFTEKDITEKEKEEILKVIEGQSGTLVNDMFSQTGETEIETITNTSGKKNTKEKGRVEYNKNSTPANYLPGTSNLARALGNFGYETNPEDNSYYNVNDLYNFYNPARKERSEYYESLNGMDKLKAVLDNTILSPNESTEYDLDDKNQFTGLRGLLYPYAGEVGMAYMGKDNSTPVKIKLKKRK